MKLQTDNILKTWHINLPLCYHVGVLNSYLADWCNTDGSGTEAMLSTDKKYNLTAVNAALQADFLNAEVLNIRICVQSHTAIFASFQVLLIYSFNFHLLSAFITRLNMNWTTNFSLHSLCTVNVNELCTKALSGSCRFRKCIIREAVMWSETVGLRTRPVGDQKNRSWSCTLWSWSCRSVVLWNTNTVLSCSLS